MLESKELLRDLERRHSRSPVIERFSLLTNKQELFTMTTRELMSAASVLMLLAGMPALAMAEEAAAPAVEATTEAPADDATTTDEGAADEEATKEEAAPAE